MHTAALTALASIAFAAVALLCDRALAADLLDAASFSSVAAVTAAALLAWLVRRKAPAATPGARAPRDFVAAAALAITVLVIPYAFTTLDAGSGALLLFAGAHLTLLVAALRHGPARPATPRIVGFCLAAAGLIYLLVPGDGAPPMIGVVAMTVAGIAWGIHALRAGDRDDVLESTSRSMTLAVVPVLMIHVAVADSTLVTLGGVLVAICAGILAAVCGLAAWYAASPRLAPPAAATAQIAVPLIAALGGVVLFGEEPGARLIVAAACISGGVLLAASGRAARLTDS